MGFRNICASLFLFISLLTITNDHLFKKSLAFGSGSVLGAASQIAHSIGTISKILPISKAFEKECYLFSQLSGEAAHHIFKEGFKNSTSLSSWERNQKNLSQIPAVSTDLKKLLLFLERRWLSKANGFYEAEVNWICPSFGYSLQVDPITTNCYARDPANTASQVYLDRIESWKEILPHPKHFPLILSRPANILPYLPSCVVDLTDCFSKPEESWESKWAALQEELLEKYDPNETIFIQTLKEGEVGGIRILPLNEKKLESQAHFLLEWMACFGLCTNPVELDRFFLTEVTQEKVNSVANVVSKESFLSSLHSFLKDWKSEQFEKTLMVNGVIKTVICLFETVDEKKWDEIQNCATRSGILKACISQIEEETAFLNQKGKDLPFFNMVSHLEEIHANLLSLIEIFSPFSFDDLLPIYRNCLPSMPCCMKEMTFSTVHSAGMTTIAGILQAAKPKKILYGNNIYFECEKAFDYFGRSIRVEYAKESDWEEADLLFVQYNPVLKRGKHFELKGYSVENVEEMIHKALREDKALTVAIDCTLDYIDSEKVNSLLEVFQSEVERGLLNFICYRSGLKFDVFGMDNFSGAPLLMIHNRDSKWETFNLLLTDPALKTDPLSLNWFCLAFKGAYQELEQYRKLIFTNTRTLLDQVPSDLISSEKALYRVIPMDAKADAAFIDIKVFGPFHQIRASALVGGTLYLKSMEEGHPLFCRRSFGFYHPNFGIIYDDEYTTVRLTLGLDPDQISLYKKCFEMIGSLNI